MENASKALVMAGSVLIALMIIGALILMFNGLSSYQKVGEQNTKEAQVIEFNNQFETFNRQDVRGSDLYSLINHVVDYNRRKSTKGIGNDQGQYLAYEPMKIEFTINPITGLSADGKANKLIKSSGPYIIDGTKNTFEAIYNKVAQLEQKYGKQVLQNLCTAKDKIFITSDNDSDKKKAIDNFNTVYGEKKYKVSDVDINAEYSKMEGEFKETVVYPYYEYIQFKRARFKCTKTDYHSKTGRIIQMKFEFTGKFE